MSKLNPSDPHKDYQEKSKALQDLSRNKDVDQATVQQRRLDLDKEYSKLKKENNMISFADYLIEKGICWKGYKRKPGTKPYEDGSCVKEGYAHGFADPHAPSLKGKREDDEYHNEPKPAFKAKKLMDRPHTVHIDNKPWKEFSNGHQAHAAAKTLQSKGKKAIAIARFKEHVELEH